MNRFGMMFFAGLVAAFSGCCMAHSCGHSEFTIVSYNIRHGKGVDGKLDIARIGRLVADQKPRFAGIQEVDMLTERVGGIDTCAELAKATGMHATFAKAIPYSGGEYGVALLSREKPLSVRRVPLPGKEPRVLLLCEFDDCWVGNTHLDVSMQNEIRLESVRIMERELRTCAGKPVFVMGDWNSKPSSDVLSGIRRFMRVLSCEDKATFHGSKVKHPKELENANHCIDYIAVDASHADSYDVVDASVVEERRFSDHAPIRLTIRQK